MNPVEVELVAIVNQKTTEEIKKELEDLELAKVEKLKQEELENAARKCEIRTKHDEDKEEVVVSAPEYWILEPGKKIRPNVSTEIAKKLAERLYGIVTKDIEELISYDDKNFLIQVDRNIKNPIIPKICPHGYVMKIINTLDSKKRSYFDAQTQMLVFLEQMNIKCPKPVMNIYGKYFSVEIIDGIEHIVRLLEYQTGTIFKEIPKTNHLMYQAGKFVATIDKSLKNFQNNSLKKYKTVWMLENVPLIEKFKYVMKDTEKLDLVEQVIESFQEKVLKNLDKFECGIIHGDFNEQNILVDGTGVPNEYRVSGVLDFGDTNNSPYVFELAITMCYMMLQTCDLGTGGYVIAGYSMIRQIPEHEKKILKIAVAARLCQSLVIGAYTNSLEPDNVYPLTTQENGWKLLNLIWNEPDDKLEELWTTTADNYLKQSTK